MLVQMLSPAKKMVVNIAGGRRGWLGRSLRLSGQIGHWPLQSLVVSKPQNMPFPSLPDTQFCVSHQHTAMVENKNTVQTDRVNALHRNYPFKSFI